VGGEVTIDIHPHPLDWLHFENSFAYVGATQKDQPDSTKYLPLIPPAKWSSELRATAKALGKNISNAYLMIELENYWKQNRYFAAYGTETATPGYALLNVGMGADITSKGRTLCSLYINANNLADIAYQSHLSRLKYAEVNNVTGRAGVYNMGRNFSVKLMIPLVFADL
jgi:iron complex outermembrane receptor protein